MKKTKYPFLKYILGVFGLIIIPILGMRIVAETGYLWLFEILNPLAFLEDFLSYDLDLTKVTRYILLSPLCSVIYFLVGAIIEKRGISSLKYIIGLFILSYLAFYSRISCWMMC